MFLALKKWIICSHFCPVACMELSLSPSCFISAGSSLRSSKRNPSCAQTTQHFTIHSAGPGFYLPAPRPNLHSWNSRCACPGKPSPCLQQRKKVQQDLLRDLSWMALAAQVPELCSAEMPLWAEVGACAWWAPGVSGTCSRALSPTGALYKSHLAQPGGKWTTLTAAARSRVWWGGLEDTKAGPHLLVQHCFSASDSTWAATA